MLQSGRATVSVTYFTNCTDTHKFVVIQYSPSAILRGESVWGFKLSNRKGCLKIPPVKPKRFRIKQNRKIWRLNWGRYKLNWLKSKLRDRSYSKAQRSNIPCNFTEFIVSSNIMRGCYVKIWVLFPRSKLGTIVGSFIIFERSLPGALTVLICPAGVADHKTLKGLCQREREFKG